MMHRHFVFITALCWLAGCASTSGPATPLVIKQNGGWNWFSDARVVIDGDRIVMGTVAGTTGRGYNAGDVQVTTFDLATQQSRTVMLAAAFAPVTATSASDDHMVPVLLMLPDGRYLAVWQKHDVDALMRWAISARPHDATTWGAVQTVSANTIDNNGLCFSNVFRLSAEHRIYNLARSVGYDPNYLVSDDDGRTFRYGGHLMMWENPFGKGLGRPYIRYASNNVDTIWLATTEDHPKDYPNGIWAGFIGGGGVYQSDGARIGALSTTTETTIKPTDFTQVFVGKPDAVAYINDLQLMPGGGPHLVFSVRRDDAGRDIRYWYARFDGRSWNAHEIARAGSTIYAEESSYAGLAALDPDDAGTMFISANADPVTGSALAHYEIFRGTTTDQGATWSWAPVTRDSTQDNIRPLVPERGGAQRRVLLWLRGTMTTFKNYDLDVVGLMDERPTP